jgi:hypothetical protein
MISRSVGFGMPIWTSRRPTNLEPMRAMMRVIMVMIGNLSGRCDIAYVYIVTNYNHRSYNIEIIK